MCRRIRLHILVNGRRRVDVVDDEVETSVIVEIRIRRAVREAGLVEAPCVALVAKGQVAVIAKGVAMDLVPTQLPQSPQRAEAIAGAVRIGDSRRIVEIVDGFGITAADEDVLVAVVIEIGEQGRPAPIGVGYAREPADVAEGAVVQLERIQVVVDTKPSTAQLVRRAIRLESAHALLPT